MLKPTASLVFAGCALLTSFAHAEIKGEANISVAHAQVDQGYPSADIRNVGVLLDVLPTTKIGFTYTNLDAWGGHATIGGVSVRQVINDRFGVDASFAASNESNITIRQRETVIVKYNALAARNLILGVGVDKFDMRGGGSSTSILGQAVYYVPNLPLVLQGDYTGTRSDFNSHYGNRIGAAVTYGHVYNWTVSAHADTGRVNYELIAQPGSIADYNSRSFGVGANYWLSKTSGIDVAYGNVSNRYFNRDEIRVGHFWKF